METISNSRAYGDVGNCAEPNTDVSACVPVVITVPGCGTLTVVKVAPPFVLNVRQLLWGSRLRSRQPLSQRERCLPSDHKCVDGLSCVADANGNLTCSNSNLDDDGSTVVAFHDSTRCVIPDLDHSWFGTHKEVNFLSPNSTLTSFLSDGFVRVNDLTEQLDSGTENATDDQTNGVLQPERHSVSASLPHQKTGRMRGERR